MMEGAEDGSVRFQIVARGTHTGAPYAYGPFSPIPTTGRYLENDPEESTMYFIGDKIFKHVISPKGEGQMTGFAGFYTQLGGFPCL